MAIDFSDCVLAHVQVHPDKSPTCEGTAGESNTAGAGCVSSCRSCCCCYSLSGTLWCDL